MDIELWALETTQGEAIVGCAGRWYRLRRETRWRPEDLGDREPPLPWGVSWVRVGEVFSSFAALVAGIEAALSARAGSADEVRAALRTVREREADPRAAWRETCRSLLALFQGRLDALFAGRGCTPEEALPLILETFRRVYLLGPMDFAEVEVRLPQMAADVFRERYGGIRVPVRRLGREMKSGSKRSALEGVLLDALADIDTMTLRCLALWADPRYRGTATGEARVAAALRISEEEVRSRIHRAAEWLGCTREQLRTAKMHGAYLDAFRGRLD